jgi:signal transduction histidine kinase
MSFERQVDRPLQQPRWARLGSENERRADLSITDPPAPSPRGEAGRSRSLSTIGKQILLVEDDASISEAVHEVLTNEGYVVTTAQNGRQALALLSGDARPDLIVLDLRMPEMDGWEFRAAQKADPRIADIPVLALSADGSAKAEAISAHAYLRKPVRTGVLISAVHNILQEEEHRRLLGRLEEAERFAALGRLASGVGHEINNPLAFVFMNVDLVRDELSRLLVPDLPIPAEGELRPRIEQMRAMLDESRIGLDRIRDCVKNLLILSRSQPSRREPYQMNELLQESLAMAKNHVAHRAKVVTRFAELPPLHGDRSQLGQAFLNLLLNAAQSLPVGGADSNEIVISTAVIENAVSVEIRDTGAGIPAAVLPRIFEPFYTTKPIGEGTGLGLAVSHRIVAEHGGRIQVDSVVDRGTTVVVVVPLPVGRTAQPDPLWPS